MVSAMSNTFDLWHPIIFDDQMRCCFDVTRSDFEQLNQGSPPLMMEFLSSLEIDGTPANWCIEPFCSPYYSNAMKAHRWEDRYPMAWRVCISFGGPIAKWAGPRFFGPEPTGGTDPTWEEQEDSRDRSTRVCVIIADFLDAQWATSLRDFEQEPVFRACRKIHSVRLTPRLVQGRFDMGEVHLPDDENRTVELLEACRSRASSVNWQTTLLLSQRLSLDKY